MAAGGTPGEEVMSLAWEMCFSFSFRLFFQWYVVFQAEKHLFMHKLSLFVHKSSISQCFPYIVCIEIKYKSLIWPLMHSNC